MRVLAARQHDTGDMSQASLWQKDSDTLASEGMAVTFAGGFPLLAVFALWDDPSEPLWCAGGVSLPPPPPPSSWSAHISVRAATPPHRRSLCVSQGSTRRHGSECVSLRP